MGRVTFSTSPKLLFFNFIHTTTIYTILSALYLCVSCDLRFCSNGPHRIRDTDCPGGFIAKVPINVTCAYYAISDALPDGSRPQIIQDYCASPDPMELPTEGDNVQIQQFQEIYNNIIDPDALPSSPGDFKPFDVCESSCLKDWRDPNEIAPEDHLIDIPPPTPDNATAHEREKALTRKIFMNLIMDDNFEEDDPEGTTTIYDPLFYEEENSTEQRVINLLAKSMQIVLSQCNPYVEPNFLRQVLKAMIFLSKLNKRGNIDVGIEEYKRINTALNQCLTQVNNAFQLKGSHCETFYKVESIEFKKLGLDWNYRIQARSFVWNMYDPIIEAAWAVIDFVHGYCFPSFVMVSFNHHHIYQIAMESLFPDDSVLKHWMTPTILSKGDGFWNSVLETGDIKIAMRNLDACAIGGYSVTPYRHRLERAFTPEDMLAAPKYTPIPADTADGWTRSIPEYWSHYDVRGGFKRFAEQWGYCLQDNKDPDVRNRTMFDIKDKLCPSNP